NKFIKIKGNFLGKISNDWNILIVNENTQEYLKEWLKCKTGLFNGKRRQEIISTVSSFSNKPIDKNNIEEKLRALNEISEDKEKFKITRNKVPSAFFELNIDGYSTSEIADKIYGIKGLVHDLLNALNQEETEENVKYVGKLISQNKADIKTFIATLNKIQETYNLISENLCLDASLSQESLYTISELFSKWNNNITNIADWCYSKTLFKQFEDKPYLSNAIRQIVSGEQATTVCKSLSSSFYKTYIEHTIRENPILRRYSNDSFEVNISRLKAYEDEYRKYILDYLPSAIHKNYTLGRGKSEIDRFIKTKGRKRSIRSLFSSAGTYITDLCPCFLMSPLSVAQYLEVGTDLFDIVIFDEASQIQTCKAVGAMARGKNVIVVGDSKQMPPTNFFIKQIDNSDYEYSESINIQDLDSILDDCDNLGMFSIGLEWHYRSKNESLIYFCNKHYYNGMLKTYPSLDAMSPKVYPKLVNGYYQPSSDEPNPTEAREIVRAIKELLEGETRRSNSIGVITFNEKQQRLIIDKLDELFEKNPDL
ncbi:MAG: hypothetical protein HUK24_02080, partial [Sphaerochaetaceae bacterium]|nr:hypothetical protein [Sphaerochaetaceae bacterium]